MADAARQRLPERPRAIDDVIEVELDGEVVLYSPRSCSVHRFDATATAVWLRLDGRRSVPTLATELAEAYGADPEVVAKDVAALLGQLAQQGLLEGVPADPEWLASVSAGDPFGSSA